MSLLLRTSFPSFIVSPESGNEIVMFPDDKMILIFCYRLGFIFEFCFVCVYLPGYICKFDICPFMIPGSSQTLSLSCTSASISSRPLLLCRGIVSSITPINTKSGHCLMLTLGTDNKEDLLDFLSIAERTPQLPRKP